MLSDDLQQFLNAHKFPSEEAFFHLLAPTGDLFLDQEGPNWDFKREWPHSYSDAYYEGIARAICGFANSQGGYIIFGVHNEKRSGGHNKVLVNLDKLQAAITQTVGTCPPLEIRRYKSEKLGETICLMILQRAQGVQPYRFMRGTSYPPNVIWVRQGHEIQRADPLHIPMLYCRVSAEEDIQQDFLSGSLPPNPRTLRRFIGRLEAFDSLFDWLFNSDEPRIFLWGKGGSGKTSIAYEFARVLQRYGRGLKIYNGSRIDNVIFLTAKELAVNPTAGTQRPIEPDFSDEQSLYSKILQYGGWTSDEEALKRADVKDLRKQLQEFFDITTNVIVIDDIDTLTTKGVEPGIDQLYKLLARSKVHSKILYTLRSVPLHSISNSVEVPGLPKGGEYEEFIDQSANQYGVPPPPPEFRDGVLDRASERRPLVVEYIIALRRTAGTYPNALSLFEGDTGEDIRDYVFKREWTALADGVTSRSMLAVLALLDKPATFADLTTILSTGDARTKDAIANTKEMFLVVNDAGNEATYSLEPFTRDFVRNVAPQLDLYATIKARVGVFQKQFFAQNPVVSRIEFRVENAIRRGYRDPDSVGDAWLLVTDRALGPAITEQPQFKSLFGYVASQLQPPKLMEARDAFEYIFNTNYEPRIQHLKGWFHAERESGAGFEQCRRIADFVWNARSYDKDDKYDFIFLKAAMTYRRARERQADEPTFCADELIKAVELNLICYKYDTTENTIRVSKSEEYARNTAYGLIQVCIANFALHQTIAYFHNIIKIQNVYFDPIEEPAFYLVDRTKLERYQRSDLHRSKAELTQCLNALNSKSWLDQSALNRVRTKLKDLMLRCEGAALVQ